MIVKLTAVSGNIIEIIYYRLNPRTQSITPDAANNPAEWLSNMISQKINSGNQYICIHGCDVVRHRVHVGNTWMIDDDNMLGDIILNLKQLSSLTISNYNQG